MAPSAIHDEDPYRTFSLERYAPDLQGWGSQSPIFEAVIRQLRPRHIVEVGTWKGASAIHMADLMKRHNHVGEIICVDTWLGGPEVWLERDNPALRLPRANGRPVIYEQFLANVIHSGHKEMIIPFPADSITAAKVLEARGLRADAIYVDAGHEYEHVMSDLNAWWDVLRPDGLMFGDDYHVRWLGVVRAVNDFFGKREVSIQSHFPDKWLVQKPSAPVL